jgi:hypothetical protein
MKNLTQLSVLFLPYLIVCGGLYHIAYWATFNINGLAYIGVTDIIKSAIYPFLTFGLIIIVGTLYSEFVYGLDDIFPRGGGRETAVGMKLNSRIGIAIVLTIWIILVILIYKQGGTSRWLIWGFLIAVVPSIILERLGLFSNTLKDNTTRQLVIRLLIYIPAFCFAAGKYNSEMIQKNIHYQYTLHSSNSLSPKIDTLKLIGNSDKQYFMTDLNNSYILILRSDKIDSLVLWEH